MTGAQTVLWYSKGRGGMWAVMTATSMGNNSVVTMLLMQLELTGDHSMDIPIPISTQQ